MVYYSHTEFFFPSLLFLSFINEINLLIGLSSI